MLVLLFVLLVILIFVLVSYFNRVKGRLVSYNSRMHEIDRVRQALVQKLEAAPDSDRQGFLQLVERIIEQFVLLDCLFKEYETWLASDMIMRHYRNDDMIQGRIRNANQLSKLKSVRDKYIESVSSA